MTDLPRLLRELEALQPRLNMDARHSYRLDGKHVRNVTTIGRVVNKPQLNNWMVRTSVEGVARQAYHCPPYQAESEESYCRRISDAAAEMYEHEKLSDEAKTLGKELHASVEHYCKGKLGEPCEEPFVSAKAADMFRRWLEWAQDMKLTPLAVEKRVYHVTDNYTGTFDLLTMFRDRLALLDWKTSTGTAVWPEHRYQSVAYRAALYSMGWDPMDGYVVKVPQEGPVEATLLEFGAEFDELYQGFKAQLLLTEQLAALEKRGRKAKEKW